MLPDSLVVLGEAAGVPVTSLHDIQVVFLYPWAVELKQLKLFGLVEMLAFVLILIVGFVYAWKKGVLKWK